MGHIDANQVSCREEYAEPETSEEVNDLAAGGSGDSEGQSDDAWTAGDFETDEEFNGDSDGEEMDAQSHDDSDEEGELAESLDDD